MLNGLKAAVGNRRLLAAGVALTALALIGGYSANTVFGQPGGGFSNGTPGVTAAAATGAGTNGPCDRQAYDAQTAQVSPAAFPTGTVVLTVNIRKTCAGPMQVESLLQFRALAGEDLGADAEALCTGGGCPVTNVPILAEPGVAGGFFVRGPNAGTEVGMRPFDAIFPNLPIGNYTVRIRAYSGPGGPGTDVAYRTLFVTTFGPNVP